MTNAQNFRKMSDAQMAAAFTHYMTCMRCPAYKVCRGADDCYACLFAWLQMEVEKDE